MLQSFPVMRGVFGALPLTETLIAVSGCLVCLSELFFLEAGCGVEHVEEKQEHFAEHANQENEVCF